MSAVLLHCSTDVKTKTLYLVAATVQEQSHIKFVWTTTMHVWTLHIYACLLCAMTHVHVCRCVRVCVLVCWNLTFQLFVFFALLAAAVAAAVSCRMYHTVPQALKLSTLWQPRNNSSRTASVCGPLLSMRVLI